jgi:hypothetical protein
MSVNEREMNRAFNQKLLSLAVADFKKMHPEIDMRSFFGVTHTGGHYFVESDRFGEGESIYWDGKACDAYEAKYKALASWLRGREAV